MSNEWYEAERSGLETIMTLLIFLVVLLIGTALVIEAETGKPVKAAVQEWLQ